MQSDLALNVYDFEWRQYDPTIARTTTQDPHADFYWELSPYSFLANNPLNTLDPTGMDTTKVNNLDMNTFNPDADVVLLDEVVVTPGEDDAETASTSESSNGGSENTSSDYPWYEFFADHNPGGDFLYEVNQFNPVAIIANSTNAYFTGTDTYGNQMSAGDATVNLAMAIPIGRAAGTTTKIATHLHHSYPKFLGGKAKQKLTQIAATAHIELHRKLNQFLKSITKNGKSMAPSKGNSGAMIRDNFTKGEREKALSDFYTGPGKEFVEAAKDFFSQID